MPSPRPSPTGHAAALSRRAALLGAVGGATVACSPYELQTQRPRPPRPTPTRAEAPPVDPDVTLATTVVAAERALLERIDATVRRHPRLERTLAAAREVHETHVAMLEDAVPEEPAQAEPTVSADATDPTLGAGSEADPDDEDAGADRVPRDRDRALRAVATAEDELALAAKQAAFAAQSGAFARVLASMAAAAAQQSAVLRSTRVGGGRR